jgi:hypothetical protein
MTTKQTQHTPGPWRVESAGSESLISSGHWAGLATVVTHMREPDAAGRDRFIPTDEGEANARLIAAAPELLAALEAIAAIPCCHDSMPECPRELAKAAIAKAKGA